MNRSQFLATKLLVKRRAERREVKERRSPLRKIRNAFARVGSAGKTGNKSPVPVRHDASKDHGSPKSIMDFPQSLQEDSIVFTKEEENLNYDEMAATASPSSTPPRETKETGKENAHHNDESEDIDLSQLLNITPSASPERYFNLEDTMVAERPSTIPIKTFQMDDLKMREPRDLTTKALGNSSIEQVGDDREETIVFEDGSGSTPPIRDLSTSWDADYPTELSQDISLRRTVHLQFLATKLLVKRRAERREVKERRSPLRKIRNAFARVGSAGKTGNKSPVPVRHDASKDHGSPKSIMDFPQSLQEDSIVFTKEEENLNYDEMAATASPSSTPPRETKETGKENAHHNDESEDIDLSQLLNITPSASPERHFNLEDTMVAERPSTNPIKTFQMDDLKMREPRDLTTKALGNSSIEQVVDDREETIVFEDGSGSTPPVRDLSTSWDADYPTELSQDISLRRTVHFEVPKPFPQDPESPLGIFNLKAVVRRIFCFADTTMAASSSPDSDKDINKDKALFLDPDEDDESLSGDAYVAFSNDDGSHCQCDALDFMFEPDPEIGEDTCVVPLECDVSPIENFDSFDWQEEDSITSAKSFGSLFSQDDQPIVVKFDEDDNIEDRIETAIFPENPAASMVDNENSVPKISVIASSDYARNFRLPQRIQSLPAGHEPTSISDEGQLEVHIGIDEYESSVFNEFLEALIGDYRVCALHLRRANQPIHRTRSLREIQSVLSVLKTMPSVERLSFQNFGTNEVEALSLNEIMGSHPSLSSLRIEGLGPDAGMLGYHAEIEELTNP